ncbi:MAG: RnfH family protein [Gammaproteobacteria bacterium]|nr:RnfH family protein [Gammaproteobacteria bacterium]
MTKETMIEIAYATPENQKIIVCHIEQGTSPRDAVKQSDIIRFFPEIDPESCDLGVFGKAIAPNYELTEGDRIEIYRPLIADPKEVRRQRAAQGLKTGKGGGKIEE